MLPAQHAARVTGPGSSFLLLAERGFALLGLQAMLHPMLDVSVAAYV